MQGQLFVRTVAAADGILHGQAAETPFLNTSCTFSQELTDLRGPMRNSLSYTESLCMPVEEKGCAHAGGNSISSGES